MALVSVVVGGALLEGCGEIKTPLSDGGNEDGGDGNEDGGDGNEDGGSGSDGNGGAGVCEASKALRCDGNVLVSCNGDGTAEVQTTCGLRCNATAIVCQDLVAPSNDYAAQLDAAANEPALDITASTSFVVTTDFNATTGTVKVGTKQVKAAVVPGANGGPDVLVLSVNSLRVAPNVTLTILSESGNPRQVAIMSAGDVSIGGTIMRNANGDSGGNDPCFGVSANAAGADNDVPGGGGGGFATPGGTGGAITTVATGANGGGATGGSSLVPLRGGCRGGNTASLGTGGSGGGAIQITSGTTIAVSGVIGAPGLGGSINAGGGSGGGILLEAPSVTVSGGVFANGGAGGCGMFSSGADGTMSTSPALGGPCTNGQSGGNGGAGTASPTSGQSLSNASGTTQYAGGGGGAAGRIRINTLDMTVTVTGATSPPASRGVIAGR